MIRELLATRGLTSMEAVNAYGKKLREEGITDEDVEFLNPDKLDAGEFWQIASELDNCSIVGGNFVKDNTNKEEINKLNRRLAGLIGLFDYMEFHDAFNYLEIGAGFGSVFEYIQKQGEHFGSGVSYTGIDVVPRFDKICKTDGFSIPEVIKDISYHFVISSNVFQHLSNKQKENYIKEAYEVLVPRGRLIIACSTHDWFGGYKFPLKHRDKDEYYYFTCGQLVKTEGHSFYYDLFYKYKFNVMQVNRKCDGFSCFICEKV